MKKIVNKLIRKLFFGKQISSKEWSRMLLTEMYILEAQGKKPCWQNFVLMRKDHIEKLSKNRRHQWKVHWKWLEKNSSKQQRYQAYLMEKESFESEH